MEGVAVDAAGEDLAGGWDDGVVGAGEAGDGVEEDDDVAAILDEPLGPLKHHLGDGHMLFCRFVKGGGDDLAFDRPGHVGDLFGALVDEQHNELHLGVVLADGVGDALHEHGLAGAGRRDDERALALADGNEEVEHAG